MVMDKQIELPCGCCNSLTPSGMLVPDEDFGNVCPYCDLEMAEAEWDGIKAAKENHQPCYCGNKSDAGWDDSCRRECERE